MQLIDELTERWYNNQGLGCLAHERTAMAAFLVMLPFGSCVPAALLPAFPAGPITISKPVGQGFLARNLPDDVVTVQTALNQVTKKGLPGGPIPDLEPDGIKGPKTQAAINNFQKIQVKGIIPDGLIEPDKQTILRLNEILAPVSKFDLNAKLAVTLPTVRASLAAAIRNVSFAIARPGTPAAAAAEDRLNRHFSLDTLDPAEQSDARLTLFQTYSDMALVVNRPDLFGMLGAIEAFDIDWTIAVAAAALRGVFEPPLLADGSNNPERHIRVGPSFFKPTVTSEFAAYILIHELAHFTSRRDGQGIDDFGRGWFDGAFVRMLNAETRLLNADSYASFAIECRTGSSARPPYVQDAPGGAAGRRSI
jgi:hypothetical protein